MGTLEKGVSPQEQETTPLSSACCHSQTSCWWGPPPRWEGLTGLVLCLEGWSHCFAFSLGGRLWRRRPGLQLELLCETEDPE